MLVMARAQTRFGNYMLGAIPRVVGTVSRVDTLAQLAVGANRDCDIVEIRLDLIGSNAPEWVEHARAIEAHGFPFIVTLRLTEEGGQWKQTDEARIPLFEIALLH